MSTKDRAIDAFKTVMGSKEPFHERIIGQLGDAAGTVEVPGRPNINYVRLGGSETLTVRAYNLAVMPELDRYVWVEITRVEGEPKYYRVVGYSESESEGAPASPPVYPGGQSAEEPVVVWETGDGFFENEKVHSALTGAEVHTNIASKIEMLEITAATYDDVQDWLNSTQSSGRISGGTLSVNGGDATKLDIAAGTGFIKVTDSCIGVTKFFNWDASLAKALTDGQANYIYVNYNVGTGAVTVEATVTRSDIPITTAFTLGRVFRDGANLHIIQSGVNIYCAVRLNHERLVAVRGFERASGGVVAESGQRYLTTTDGVFYLGANLDTTSAQDTTGADRFIAWYLLNGTWTETAPQQQIDNLQYNDVSVGGAEVLANLTVNRYGVFWVYIHMDSDIQVVYGQDDYKLAGAENATVPSNLPESVTEFGILAAKIIVRQNANNLLSIASAYTTPFPVSQPVNHNDLGGLQGGTTDEYYHLTATEHGYVSGVNAQSVLTTATPTFEAIVISAAAPQLTLQSGAVDYATFVVAADGQLTITTVDDDAAQAHIVLAPDGDVQIASGNLVVADGTTIKCAVAPAMTFDDTLNELRVIGASLKVGYDANRTSYLGRAAVGYDGSTSDYATFAHIDRNNATNYALRQGPSGNTDINATTGQSVTIRINDVQALTILPSTYVGVNTVTPRKRVDILDDTYAQLRLTHTDGVDFADFQVDSGGDLLITASGGNISFGDEDLDTTGSYFVQGTGAYAAYYCALSFDNGQGAGILWYYDSAAWHEVINFADDNTHLPGLIVADGAVMMNDVFVNKLGVGTDVPGVELHVYSGDAEIELKIQTAGTDTDAILSLQTEGFDWNIRVDDERGTFDGTLVIEEAVGGELIQIDPSGVAAHYTFTVNQLAGQAACRVISAADSDPFFLFVSDASTYFGYDQSEGIFKFNGPGNGFSGSNDLIIAPDGNIGINIAAPLGKVHVDQAVVDAAIPVLILDQADVSEGFINFIGADQGVIDEGASSVESVFVEYGGVVRRLALYAT